MSFILRHLRNHRQSYLWGVLFLIATNALAMSIPWRLKGIIDSLKSGEATTGALALAALIIAATAAILTITRTRSRLFILGASRRIVYDVRNELFAHMQTLPASFYGRHRTGALMSITVNDLRLIRSLFGPCVLYILDLVIAYSIALTIMVILDPILIVAAVLPYPLLLLGVYRASHTIHRRSNAMQEQLAEISNKVQENLTGINMVKAYGREDSEIESFDALCRVYRTRALALARSRGLIGVLMMGLGGASALVVFWLGGLHVIEGRLTLGGFVAFLTYLLPLTDKTIILGWILGTFQRGLGAASRITAIHAEHSDLPGDQAPGPGSPLKGQVSFRNLTFAYPNGSGTAPARLRDIDLEVPAGSLVGIVGRVGAGKSTLLRVLAGIYPVPDGTILIDGHDLNTIPTDHLRCHLGVVPQETFLFSRSIAENIALGRPDASRARVEEVAAIAQLTRDLPQFAHGLDTLVGERGLTLSGGQRQRVALARALLLEPRILLLDDALSSIDADTEEAILRNLLGYMRDRTTFVVSHRAATVLNADLIVALEDGRIAEAGAPADLLRREDGLFSRMVRQQRIERELESM
ncbi:MAG: ABC transporter ATP-binding protein [Acidobacteria bacterium]|nr:ABC transporter ATP-binding protein [Acidobacteriota bacterium]